MLNRARILVLATLAATVAASLGAAAGGGPQGTVAYVASAPSGSWISVVDVRAGASRRLTPRLTPSGAYPALSWSPDGRTLAFTGVAREGTKPGLFVVRRDGRVQRWRTLDKRSATAIREISWSADNAAVAYDSESWREKAVSYDDGCSDPKVALWIDITLSNGITRRLPAYPAGRGGTLDNIRWAPGGRGFLYLVRHWEQGHGEECDWADVELLTIRANGSGRRVVARGTSTAYAETSIANAEWSPDGKSIAFSEFSTSGNYLHEDLFVMRADGTDRRRLADNIGDWTWEDDGRRIVVVWPDRLEAVDVRTQRSTLLARWNGPDRWATVYDASPGWVAVEGGTAVDDRYHTRLIEIRLFSLAGQASRSITITRRAAETWGIRSVAVALR
jgi:dipeptidyl aminopeptidase/acylaminoacyl peptidase